MTGTEAVGAAGSPDSRYRIGDWRVEPELNRVSRNGTTIRLEPRVMDVLTYLVEHAGAVVPRRELVEGVWATEFVAANTLTHAICEIRRALGDDPRDPVYVETIPKRGYRLVAPVTPVTDDGGGTGTRRGSTHDVSSPGRRRGRYVHL